LLINDTSELDFSTHKALEGSGPLGEDYRRGFFLHSRLLVSEEEGVALGICGSEIWARSDEDIGKGQRRKSRPVSEKESQRWINAYTEACELRSELEGRKLIVVADRESDIYELYQQWSEAKTAESSRAADFVVRACRDRALAGDQEGRHLYEYLRSEAPVQGRYQLEFDNKEQRRAIRGGSKIKKLRQGRQVEITVRACQVTLRAPFRKKGLGKLQDLTLWALHAEEINPPKGQEAICWIILTSMPLGNWKQIRRVLRIYERRWMIEEYYRVLKSGCHVEQIALRQAEALLPAVVLSMIVAWRILYLRDLSRCCGELPATCFFEQIEWKALWIVVLGMKTGEQRAPPSLSEMVRELGKLGGHLARRSDKPPGCEVLWRGLQDLRRYVEAMQAIGSV
jgi:hypothetical protein